MVDTGTIPFDHQIGQTGLTIRPKICISFGVSGAIQHTEGIKDTNLYVAVNTDENAAIFGVADYGIQADLKTMLANRVYAMSVIAALTAQNTTGVDTIYDVDASFVASQMDSVFTDIYPMAVKIGMVSQKEVILSISGKLKQYHARNIVVDPVMVATSGAKLISDEAIDTLKENLFPLASVLTPNIPEAEVLSGLKINNEEEMLTAAKYIGDHYHCAVLLKGGHQINDANDLLYKEGNYQWFKGKRINNNNTHGTGCTLSSAIASYLARGENLENAVKKAKDYISGALAVMLDLGQGQGPMDHGYVLDKKD